MPQAPSFSPRPDADALRDEAWTVPLLLLRRHRVEHVVTGAAASAAYGEPPAVPTALTVVPATYARNLDRLSAALRDVAAEGARLEVEHRPAGTAGFGDLLADARPVALGDLEVLVASSEDLARMTAAAAAPTRVA